MKLYHHVIIYLKKKKCVLLLLLSASVYVCVCLCLYICVHACKHVRKCADAHAHPQAHAPPHMHLDMCAHALLLKEGSCCHSRQEWQTPHHSHSTRTWAWCCRRRRCQTGRCRCRSAPWCCGCDRGPAPSATSPSHPSVPPSLNKAKPHSVSDHTQAYNIYIYINMFTLNSMKYIHRMCRRHSDPVQ